MGVQIRFSTFGKMSKWLPLWLAILVLLTQSAVFAQTKPQRQSKAVKSNQSATPATTPATEEKLVAEEESSKPEDKPFKGMKYRLIGPFRGGRSLTAAGIPGDPQTYYFGAASGGVWKSVDEDDSTFRKPFEPRHLHVLRLQGLNGRCSHHATR